MSAQTKHGRNAVTRLIGVLLLVAACVSVLLVGLFADDGRFRQYERAVLQYAAQYDVSPALVFAVMDTESGFDANAVSAADARGLMQITPETFAWLQTKTGESLSPDALFDPDVNVRYGTLFLSILRRAYPVQDTAVAAYNAGMNAVARWLEDPAYSDDGRTLREIPYDETRFYVKKVSKALQKYSTLYE